MRIGVLCSRVRVEEKLLFQEMDRRGLDYVRIDDDEVIFHLNEASYPYDIVLERSIHHSRAQTKQNSGEAMVFYRRLCRLSVRLISL